MEKHNILVADDEDFIVDWLSIILEKELDYSVDVYRAYSAEQAIGIMSKIRIDLLITDIKMPQISGIELAKKIHSIWPNSKTILLTAYPDFTFAQQAINLNVYKYILKTSNDTEILDAISGALAQIENETNQITLINRLECELKNSRSELCRQLFFLWLNSSFHYASYDLRKTLDTLGFDMQSPSDYILLIGSPHISYHSGNSNLNNLLKPFQMQQLTAHYLEAYVSHSFFEFDEQLLIGIIQLKSAEGSYKALLDGALTLAQSACRKTLDMKVSYLLSPPCSAHEISTYYFHSQDTLKELVEHDYIYFLESPVKTNFSEETYTFSKTSYFVKSDYFNTMKKNLDNHEWKEFYSMLEEICQYLSSHVNWHNNIVLQIYYNLVLVFITYINKNNLSETISLYVSTGTLFRPWLLENWDALEKQLFRLTDALKDMSAIKENHATDKLIAVVQEYISSHITEDISLIDLSEITQYSTTYLSRYYSKITGTTITQYISAQKMKKIEQLMCDPTMKISDISLSLGFNSRNYFNNFVKRMTGLSPQKYRDTLLENIPSVH